MLPNLLLLEVLANWSSLILLRVVVARFHLDFAHIFKWLIKYLILMPQGPIDLMRLRPNSAVVDLRAKLMSCLTEE